MDIFSKELVNKMPPDARAIYDGFYGDLNKLKGEWLLCESQYRQAISFVQNKDIDYNTRTTIRNISDYWVRRRQALERVLPEDILQSFKK